MKPIETRTSGGGRQTRTATRPRFVALYMRTSYKDRWADYQTAALERWSEARRKAAKPVPKVRWYRDTWASQVKTRPERDRLVRDVESGRVETIVCWRLDRLAMSCTEMGKLFAVLDAHAVNLISLKDDLDLSTPAGRRIAGAITSMAVYESELRSDRVLAGQEAARARGSRWGGSRKGRRIKVTARMEASVKRMYLLGVKIARIAREVGLSRPTIYRLLEGASPGPRKRIRRTPPE
jgi:DNA invertase Pin-like site-specific DNA recombinase